MMLCQDPEVGGQVGKVSLILPLAPGERLPEKRVAEYREMLAQQGAFPSVELIVSREGLNRRRWPGGLRTRGAVRKSDWTRRLWRRRGGIGRIWCGQGSGHRPAITWSSWMSADIIHRNR